MNEHSWRNFMQTIVVSARVIPRTFTYQNKEFTAGDYEVRFQDGTRLCVPRDQFEFYYQEVKQL